MTLKAASDNSKSIDRPNTTPDFLGSRQWIRSFTAQGEKGEGGGVLDVIWAGSDLPYNKNEDNMKR